MSIANKIENIETHLTDNYSVLTLAGADLTDINKNLYNLKPEWKKRLLYFMNNGTQDVWDNWEKVTGSGEALTLNNVVEAPLKLVLNGNTSQVSYTGKNLFSTNYSDYDTTTDTYGFRKIVDEIPSGKYLVLSLIDNDTSVSLSSSFYLMLTTDGTFSSETKKMPIARGNKSLNESYFYTNELKYISFYPKDEETFNKLFQRYKVQYELVDNTTPTNYEPYCGGTASPNPSYPQPIHVASGDNSVVVCGGNIYNYDNNTNLSNYYLNNQGVFQQEITPSYTFINEKINITSKTISIYIGAKTGTPNIRLGQFKSDGTFISRTLINTSTNNITLDSNCDYIWLSTDKYSTTQFTNISVIYGNSISSYEPYQSQTYPISLGTLELCKIGDYQDYIYKNIPTATDYSSDRELGAWYLKKNTGKVVLDGSEDDWSSEEAYTGYYRFKVARILPLLTRGNDGFNNRFTQRVSQPHGDYQYLYLQSNNGYIHIQILQSLLTNGDVNTFKTWLSTHNTIVYYVLATPTITEITDTTLINQLNDIEYAMSKKGQTNITQVNNDKPFIIDAWALLDDIDS